MKLVDNAILSLRDEVEKDTLTPNKYNFLTYLLSREALSLKDVTVLCLSTLLDGLGTTTPTVLFCLYCLAIDKRYIRVITNFERKFHGVFDKL